MDGVPLPDAERRILTALRDESPWRFSSGAAWPWLVERFGDPYPHLERLERRGLVRYEFYGTGAVHEYAITESGRAALGADAGGPDGS